MLQKKAKKKSKTKKSGNSKKSAPKVAHSMLVNPKDQDSKVESRGKSNSITLLDDLAVASQSRRRHCNLDTSMLPIIEIEEDPKPEMSDNRPSVFRTIVPGHLSVLNQSINVKDSPRMNLYNLKTSSIQPSLLSANKSGKFTASTAFDTHFGSEQETLRGTMNDEQKPFKADLAIFCVDENEEEKDFSIDSAQSKKKRLAKSFEKSSSEDKESLPSKPRPSDVSNIRNVQFQTSSNRDHFFETESRKASNDGKNSTSNLKFKLESTSSDPTERKVVELDFL